MAAMSQPVDLAAIARDTATYSVEAFEFVGQGLRHAVKMLGREEVPVPERHLDAAELVAGVLDLAVEQFGYLAPTVLERLALRSPEDIGRITFILIDHQVFTRQPSDRFEDFLVLPGFADGFEARIRDRLARIQLS